MKMQLKLRIGVGDTLTINVEPTDTFQDLSERLFQLAGVQVDLSQLNANNKPFDMTTNVIQYFTSKPDKEESPIEEVSAGEEAEVEAGLGLGLAKVQHCRLCGELLGLEQYYLFENYDQGAPLAGKVNSSLPIHVSPKDTLPKQICGQCLEYVQMSFEFMKKVVKAQKSLEAIYSTDPKEKSCGKDECCPLCTAGNMKLLDNGVVQPASVHLKKETTKLNPNKKEVVITIPRTPTIRKDALSGQNIGLGPPNDSPYPKSEFYQNDEVVTGFWEGSMGSELMSMRKLRKRKAGEDDAEWTIDEEYMPISRRGRPKGTRNKPKTVSAISEVGCRLCSWVGGESDLLHHAINQHCQPDMGYFPCPGCKSRLPNELVLETHLATCSQLQPQPQTPSNAQEVVIQPT